MVFQYSTSLHWAFAQLGAANVEIEAYNVLERAFCVAVALVSLISTSALATELRDGAGNRGFLRVQRRFPTFSHAFRVLFMGFSCFRICFDGFRTLR